MPKNDETMFLACLLELGRPPECSSSSETSGIITPSGTWYRNFKEWYSIHYGSGHSILDRFNWEHNFLEWTKSYAKE